MKKSFLPTTLIVFLVLLLNSIYILDEKEQAVVTQFGKPVGDSITDAGLKLSLIHI